MATIDRALLKAALLENKRSARDVSLKAKLGATAVKDILSGKSRSPEYGTLTAIAAELGVSPSALAVQSDDRIVEADPRIVPRFLPIRYRVQAGNWVEVEGEEAPIQGTSAVAPHPRYSNWPQWLELVVGDSVNMKIPPGHYAHVVDAIEMGYGATDGDWVVVERRRDQGRERERTIKQIEIGRDGVVRLRPRSTNPKWGRHAVLAFKSGEPVTDAGEPLPAGEEIEVEIVGKVIGSYDPEF